ncbi:MAG: hypothetical protein K8M05_34125, partial [Deltaproteobacteria bacterium]|nr:hypothetical protein [Kofleriaceae bacterium]
VHRVAPTGVAGGVAVNTDPALEAEADATGAQVTQGFDLGGFLDFGAARAGSVAAPVAQGEDLPAPPAAAASPVPAQVMERVGAELHHADDKDGGRHYRITPAGGFLLIAAADGRGVGTLEFRHDNQFEDAWRTLADYVVAHAASIPPTAVAPPAAESPTGEEAPTEPGFFDDPLGAIGDAISGAVTGAIELGRAVLGLPSQIIEAAIDLAFGETPSDEPAVAPGTEPAAPGEEPAPPDVQPETPPGSDTPVSSDMPALSQFRWYGSGGVELNVTDVFAAAQLINSELGLGGTVEHATAPAADKKAKNPNQGYFWYTAEGKACWDGKNGGTQYVTFTIDSYGKKANPLSAWLADNPPGQRPAELVYDGKPHQASAALQNLGSRNIPGGMACFATSQSMMAQAGVHAVGNGDDAEIRDIVTSETYREYTQEELDKYTSKDGVLDEAKLKEKVRRKITAVTVDATKAEKARAYVDFETENGRPVFVGITYTDRNCNSDGDTDHWVVINAKAGAGQYTFFDPGSGSTEGVASSGNQFAWDGEKLHKPQEGAYVYVVSCIRPNQESLADWSAHWAQLQAA